MLEPLLAEIVMVSPVDPPVAETVGVVSDVRLSVDEVPRSDAAARSGIPGADGAAVSTVIGNAAPTTD